MLGNQFFPFCADEIGEKAQWRNDQPKNHQGSNAQWQKMPPRCILENNGWHMAHQFPVVVCGMHAINARIEFDRGPLP